MEMNRRQFASLIGVAAATTPALARAKGLGKGGRYGYPYLHLMDDDAFVIYSVGKEDIGIARFKLSDLS